MMDIFLIVVAFILLLAGFAGCILPALPGVPLCYLSLVVLHFTSQIDFSGIFLWGWLAIVIAILALDYFMTAWGTKRFGGSRASSVGSIVGGIVGVFFGVIGIIVGSLLGAIVGELIHSGDSIKAFRAGIGSFFGFIFGVVLKFLVCGVIAYYAIEAVVHF